MRILFICGVVETGRSGVGDYTRALARACIQNGHTASILAIHDQNVQTSKQTDEDSLLVWQLPDWRHLDRDFVNEKLGSFDVISFQIVSFAFDSKGIPFGLGSKLQKTFPGSRWHFMFHELWLGLQKGASFKMKLWGAIQKCIIRSWIRKLRPDFIHTQCTAYVEALRNLGIVAEQLSLFGNIPIRDGHGWEIIRLTAGLHEKESVRDRWLLAGVFGSIHPEWLSAFDPRELAEQASRQDRRLVLVLIGENHLGADDREELVKQMLPYGPTWILGRLPANKLSPVLAELDIGLPPSPRALIEKSGSAVAMEEHGVPLVIFRNDWRLRGEARQDLEHPLTTIEREISSALARPPPQLRNPSSHLPTIARQFLAALNV